MSEADIHFDLFHHLQTAIDEAPVREHIHYGDVRPEYSEGISGRADIVVFDNDDNPLLVIEAKRPDDTGRGNLDPYAPDVIRQAFRYAGDLGARYFATYNGDRMVLFNAWEEGRTLLERSTKSYDGITNVAEFCDGFLSDLAAIDSGNESWDDLDDAFIERIRTLHEFISPQMYTALSDQLNEDDEFRGDFIDWAEKQGIEYIDANDGEKKEILQNFSEQATYLLINKIVFYKILEDSAAYGDAVTPLAVSIHRVQEDLEEHFAQIVDNVDFEAVFEHDDIYNRIPLDPVSEKVREFIIELDDQDLTQFNSDVIGRIYEGVIPPERRHEMGEYYTPPSVCDLITRLTIDSSSDTVLDPACGSGGFLVSSYQRLRSLLPESTGGHTEILNRIYGTDINRFPAHLSAINLALQDLESYTEDVNIEVSDFFTVAPDTQRFGRVVAGLDGKEWRNGEDETLGGFDAVVGNPPYIRNSNISENVPVRNHLSNVDADYLSDNSDIFAYFLTHGTEFLADDGRLGFIVSDGWLQTQYGEDVQHFLLDNYVVESVIKFDRQVFEDALVGTNVVILQREENSEVRDTNVTKFIRIKESMAIDDMVDLVERDDEPQIMTRTDKYRLVTREQATLYDEDKWSIFFLAPPAYFEIVDTDASTEFTNLASQHRANTSGANSFFHLKEKNIEDLGLEDYVSPLAKASGQMERTLFTDSDAEEWGMLDVHDFVQEALNDGNGEFGVGDEQRVKQWFADNRHEPLLEYVEWGEDQDEHTGSTCAARNIWFDLGDLDRTRILIPRFTWTAFRVIWNEANAVANDQFYNVHTETGIDEKVLCGVLNTRLVWMFYELHGRTVGGEGMNRTEIKGYEINDLPVPDIRNMDPDDKQAIRDAFDELLDREREIGDEVDLEEVEDEQDALDQAVLEAIGMEDRVDEVRRAVRGLVAMREQAGGINTEVLVERGGTEDDPEVIDLPGVSNVRESTTLTDFD
jgi:type I restriction-modification system DNA methylase subunit